MPFTPKDSAIRMTPELEAALRQAGPEEMKRIFADAAVAQGLATRDLDPNILIPTPLADAAPRRVGKVIVLNGVKHSLVANDEAALLEQENALYRQAMQPAATEETQTEQPRNELGQFTTAEAAANRAELELRFKRGDIEREQR
jgi:hypothetical protein